jgi:NADPH-dependent 2,4-dienoyl-CoA reductase/sulfur reductase-like enzyme
MVALLRTLFGHRRRDLLVEGGPEEVLLAAAAALRRLGARITRYDADEATLEARLDGAAAVRLDAVAEGAQRTRLMLESDGRTARRFRRALARGGD